jgi:Na+/melibiose symporter-like transporter
MIITLFAPHQAATEKRARLNWFPFLRLVLMTAAFTALVLGIGQVVEWLVGGLDSVALVGLIGVGAMLAAALLGVWLSVRISMGAEIKENRSFLWWVMNRLTFMVASTNLAGFMVFFLQEKFPELAGEKAAGPAAQIVMFVGIFILLLAIPSGWLADRFGKKILIALAGVLVAAGAALVIISPEMNLIYVGASIVGAGVGLFYSANWALGTEIVPKEEVGRFLGIQNLAGTGSGAIGAYIGGTIADERGYVLLMSIYGVMALMSILPLLGVKKSES